MFFFFISIIQLFIFQAQETPLHISARTKEGEKCAEMLLKSGADVNATREVIIIFLEIQCLCEMGVLSVNLTS